MVLNILAWIVIVIHIFEVIVSFVLFTKNKIGYNTLYWIMQIIRGIIVIILALKVLCII